MKKTASLFVLIIFLLLIYTIPTYGEPFLELDYWDPVNDQYIFTPGLALNLELGGWGSTFQGEFDGTWTFNDKMGIKGAGIVEKYDIYIGATLFWKTGPLYMEIGPLLDSYHASIIHTGLNGFFPLIGPSGPAFENNFNICIYPDLPFTGLVKGGWMWLFGKNSHLLIGGYCEYSMGYSDTIEPHLGLVDLTIDDKVGPFLIDGKIQLDLLNIAGADGNISISYMPKSFGIGVNLTKSTIGGALKVRR